MIAKTLDRVLQAAADGPGGTAALQSARAVWAERAGPIETGDPDFEERTQAFLDWFVLDFRDAGGRTAAERFRADGPSVSREEQRAATGLCRSVRALLRIDELRGGLLRATDLLGSAVFAAEPLGDTAGFEPGDLADAHLAPFAGRAVLLRGLVFHPREAAASIAAVVPAALAAGVPREELLFALLRMRRRFDHYRGIRADKVYRFPFRGFP